MVTDYESGALSFGNGGDKAVLEKVLDYLKIPVASQMLVYSRTSLQNDRIHPETPRALYFSDDCYVGWVQGGDIEIIAVDRKLGRYFIGWRYPAPDTSNRNSIAIATASTVTAAPAQKECRG